MNEIKKRKLGSSLFKGMMGIGFVYDVSKLISFAANGQISKNIDIPEKPSNITSNALSFTGSYPGYSMGHSIDYWKKQLEKAILENRQAGIKYAKKRIRECLEDAARHMVSK